MSNPNRCGEGEACQRGYSLWQDAGLSALTEAAGLRFEGASPDLRHIVLGSPNGLEQWSEGVLEPISATPGAALAAPSGAISGDGSRVYFAEPEDGPIQLAEGGKATPIAETVGGGAAFQAASADGRYAFYTKGAHLYRWDAESEAGTDLTPAGGVEGVLGISADGSRAYYQDASGLFGWQQGTTTELAAGGDAATSSDYPPATGTSRVSPDGTHLLFLSQAELSGYEANGATEAFLYGPPPGGGAARLVCVSCNPTGERPEGSASIPGAIANGQGETATRTYKPRALSSSGNRVFFSSKDDLAPQDSNKGEQDVYEWEAQGEGSCSREGGCVGLISSGRDSEASTFIDASEDGSDAFFLSAASLAFGDPGSYDLYDARVGRRLPGPPGLDHLRGRRLPALARSARRPDPGDAGRELRQPRPALRQGGQAQAQAEEKEAQAPSQKARGREVIRRAAFCTVLGFAIAGAFAPAAQADFGFLGGEEGFSAQPLKEGGSPDQRAGAHPLVLRTEVNFNLGEELPSEPGVPVTEGDLKDLEIELPPGLVENPASAPKCSQAKFHTPRGIDRLRRKPLGGELPRREPGRHPHLALLLRRQGARGHSASSTSNRRREHPRSWEPTPTAPRSPSSPRSDNKKANTALTLVARNVPQLNDVYGLTLEVWGTPSALIHNSQRGDCLNEAEPSFGWAKCLINPGNAYLTLPTSCEGPLAFKVRADSWQEPDRKVEGTYEAPGVEGCKELPFEPVAAAAVSDPSASSATGYDFDLFVDNSGFLDPRFKAPSPIRKAVVSLPEGMTINPSVGAGLGSCTPAQYAAETASSPVGAGCPNQAKIGDFTVKTPLFEEGVEGSLYLASPYANPFGTLLAVYLIAKAPDRGILVKVAGRLDPDQATGTLTATFDRLPQLPYTDLKVHFREGQRSPLATPAACGAFASQIDLSPWNDQSKVRHSASNFQISQGVEGGPCPQGHPSLHPQGHGRDQELPRRRLYPLLPAPDKERHRTGVHLLLGDPAAGTAGKDRRDSLLP